MIKGFNSSPANCVSTLWDILEKVLLSHIFLQQAKGFVAFTTEGGTPQWCLPVSHYLCHHMVCFLDSWLVCTCTPGFSETRSSPSPHSANTPSRFWELRSSSCSAPISKYSRRYCRFMVLYLIWMGWVCRQSHVQPAAAGHRTDVTSWIRPTDCQARLIEAGTISLRYDTIQRRFLIRDIVPNVVDKEMSLR